MKHIIILLLSLLTMTNANNQDLKQLWKSYEKAKSDDLPKEQLQILEKIKTAALDAKSAWDYYDACSRYSQVKASINWKDSKAAQETFNKEIDGCGMPVAYFFKHRYDEPSVLSQYIRDNEAALQGGHNTEFYRHDDTIVYQLFGSVLQDLLANDLDYVRWSLYLRTGDRKHLEGSADGKYPLEAFAEWNEMRYDEKRGEALEAFAEKYRDKAVALFAKQELLQRRLSALEQDGKGRSADYADLAADCRALIASAKEFTGTEKKIADCCTVAGSLLERLESNTIDLNILDNQLTAMVRNIKDVKITITDSKNTKVYETTLKNKVRSFYALDSLKLTLPDFDDGDYRVKASSGDCKNETTYQKYTLSLAMKRDSKGWWAYVADYQTGQPVSGYENGFKALPSGFNGTTYQASLNDGGRKRLSRTQTLGRYGVSIDKAGDNNLSCRILSDRRAFNPEETIQYKVIAFRGRTELSAAEAGLKLQATLLGADGKEISTETLTTGEFGSAAGSFLLRRGAKNGNYTIRISQKGNILQSLMVVVDDFVLPTFEVKFDRQDRFWLPGDRISVKGNIMGYSGHTLAAATKTYTVTCNGSTVEEGVLDTDSKGDFTIEFDAGADEYKYFFINVKVVDATGETIENGTSEFVGSNDFSCEMVNSAKGDYNGFGDRILSSDTLLVRFDSRKNDLNSLGYTVKHDGKVVRLGTAEAGKTAEVDFKGLPSGEYSFEALATATDKLGNIHNSERKFTFYKLSDTEKTLSGNVKSLFKEIEGDEPALQVGTTEGPAWVVVELYDREQGSLLDRQMLKLGGKNAKVRIARFAWKGNYPDEVSLKAFFFHNKEVHSYEMTKARKVGSFDLPLAFTRFQDTTVPGGKYSFIIKTAPKVECAATIFDKSTETIYNNSWSVIRPQKALKDVTQIYRCGVNGREEILKIRGYGMASAKSAMVTGAVMEEAAAVNSFIATDDSAVRFDEEAVDVAVRENFAKTVAWEPFLRSDAEGDISLQFTNADKLSTFYVQLFAHDKSMRNSVLRREMKVTIPVKVSLVEPQFLYSGDRYRAMATLSSNADSDISGTAIIRFYDGSDYRTAQLIGNNVQKVTVPAGGEVSVRHLIDVPDIDNLGIKVSFTADSGDYGSDAMFVSTPVFKPVQTIREAHSALLKAGADRDALIAALRGQFVNADGAGAQVREVSIRQMLQEAIPQKFSASGKDAMSCSESLYAGILAKKIGSEGLDAQLQAQLVERILACRCADGGFSWMPGFNSSPIITAALLVRFTIDKSLFADCIAPAVQYLDKKYFEMRDKPIWYGNLSMEQYMYVRSFYPEIKFAGETDDKFVDAAKEYLVPAKARGLNGLIFAKARRLTTLQNLSANDAGVSLAKAWGVKFGTKSKMRNSIRKDVNSLVQYAVEHSSGGYYFPNAVMPWRGLLESELHAHTVLCHLMDDYGHNDIAEGIRLWMMIQKETQKWSDDPGYIEALDCVLGAGERTLDTKVIALEASVEKPFDDIKASGNGISLDVSDISTVRVGDRISVTYKVRSDENRSFAVLSVPRCAALRPVSQRSGLYGWNVYRNVLSDRTEYWFEVLPEEETVITEDFYITQQGSFQTPVAEIESRYAPHYRANSASKPALNTGINIPKERYIRP